VPLLDLDFFVVMVILGMVIGAITGWLSSLILKSGTGGVIRDSFLGSFGYLAGFYGCIFMPWPRNTSSEGLAGAMRLTMNLHSERVSVVVAIVLPVLHEWYRSRRKRMVTE
jgi:uncharacterized membrane protein YeaQ/YmgE (transglycosylase-associated protein family)